MTTKLNLSISSYDEQDPSASTHNTNISSSDPDELISALRKLSGIKHQEPAAKSCGCEEPCDCEMEVVDEADQEPANAPEPRTLADLRDVIDAAGGTAHTARAPTNPVPSRSGDNPLADEVHEDGISEGDGPDDTIMIDGQAVDKDSIEIYGVDTQDYPDFADAFISSATFTDWTPLTTKQLDQLQDKYPELVNELARQSLNEDLDEGEGSSKAVVGAIIRRIVNRHPELLSKYGPKAVTNAVEDVAIDLNDLEEIGTSDVSIWTQRVIDDLERQGSVKAPELDENEINTLAESLARDWMSDKLQHIAENFNPNVAAKAYSKGKTAYRHKLHEFAIREDGDLVKVFPVLEGRVMTQVPLYVMEVKLRHLLPALAVGGALGGISHMLDTRSYDNNPNIVQLKAELARTTDPTMQKEIKAAIEREKAFQDAKGRPRVAPTNESVDCMECGMGRYTPMEEGMTCDECGHMMDEGNAFSGELARARAHHEKSFDVDGHHYNVTESKKKKKKAKNPYAVGMAAAKKAAGYSSKPAKDLPKKVITKAHEIGKEIKKKK